MSSLLTPEQIAAYHRDGYIIIKNFCSKQEVDKMYSTALQDKAMEHNALDLNDQTGKKTRLSLWFTPGNDVFGYLTRSEKMVDSVANLMDSDAPVCHFHSKLMQKSLKWVALGNGIKIMATGIKTSLCFPTSW